MISEEEKKAIEKFKRKIERADKDILKFNDVYTTLDIHNLRLLLNLVEKQQKEIFRLQNIKRKDIQDLIDNEKVNIYKNYISKDKIRDYEKALEWKKQQEIENIGISMHGSAIDVLNKLLEEN